MNALSLYGERGESPGNALPLYGEREERPVNALPLYGERERGETSECFVPVW